MEDNILISLSVITTFHNENKSVLEAFLPLVEYGVSLAQANKQTNNYDIDSLQKLIESISGINISKLSLKSLMRKLEKKGAVQLIDNDNYFIILNNKKIKKDNYITAIKKQDRDIQKLIDAYRVFAEDDRAFEEIIHWIYKFIKYYRQVILIDCGSLSIDDDLCEKNHEYYRFVDFLNDINKKDNELTNIFIDIYYGYALCSVLNSDNVNVAKINLNNLTVYLDSNFILRLLDLQEKEFTSEAEELFYILKQNNARIRVFEETLFEIKNVLLFYLSIFKDKKDDYTAIIGRPDYINGVLGAFYRKKMTISKIESIIENLPNIINKMDIEVERLETYRQTVTAEEEEELFSEKYSEENSESEDYRRQKCKTYLKIIKTINYLRNNHQASMCTCLGNCRYIFLTCDLRLFKFEKKQSQKRSAYSCVVSQELLANDLFLFNPQQTGKLSLGLMIALFNSSDYVNVHILDDLAKNILEISDAKPDLTKYVIMATKNSEYYNEINKIYENEGSSKLQRKEHILALAERIKEEENRQQQKEKSHKEILDEKDGIILAMKKDYDDQCLELEELRNKYTVASEDNYNSRKRDIKNYNEDKHNFDKKISIIAIVFAAISALSIAGTVWGGMSIEGNLKILFIVCLCIFTLWTVTSTIVSITDNPIIKKIIKKHDNKLLKKYNLTEIDLEKYRKEMHPSNNQDRIK